MNGSFYFQIYLGSDTTKVLIGTYCGELLPFVINSTANRMAIHFVSDQMINSVGFTILYNFIYGIIIILKFHILLSTQRYKQKV